MIGGTLTFSDDDTVLYGLAYNTVNTSQMYLVSTGVAAVLKTPLTVSVAPIRRPYASTFVAVRSRPGVHVTVVIREASKAARTVITTVPASGVAVIGLAVTFSGSVSAAVPSDLTHLGAFATAGYTAPTTLLVRQFGYTSSSGKLRIYTRLSQIRTVIAVDPGHASSISMTLQRLSGTRWVNTGTRTFATSRTGDLLLYYTSLRKNTRYRAIVSYVPDQYSAKAQGVVGDPFLLK
jgi:hypothetical protein